MVDKGFSTQDYFSIYDITVAIPHCGIAIVMS